MQTIGQQLKAARESKQLELEKIFEATRIRVVYLQALEADDYSAMPSPVQARGYLRNYAEYLGLDIDKLLDELRSTAEPLDRVMGPADEVDSVPESDSLPEAEHLPSSDSHPEDVSGPDNKDVDNVSENIWQSWLNRISSVISIRLNKPRVEEVDQAVEEAQQGAAIPGADSQEPGEITSSKKIFIEIGQQLLQKRESLSLNLNEAERNTHIKIQYLEALEQGAMEKLPSTVQTRGMLSNYASFLDIDLDSILLRYADALQSLHREKFPDRPEHDPNRPSVAPQFSLRDFIAGDMVFGIGVTVLLVGFMIWGINYTVNLRNQRDVLPTAPSISDVLLATVDSSTVQMTATLQPVEVFPVDATQTIIVPTININVSVQVNLIAVERTYMRVSADGEVVFDGRVIPGNTYFYEGEDQIEVLVGNAAAIRVAYNGRDLGLMGSFGQIVNNIYREEEIVTPTIQPTLQSSATPTPASSPTVTTTPAQ